MGVYRHDIEDIRDEDFYCYSSIQKTCSLSKLQ